MVSRQARLRGSGSAYGRRSGGSSALASARTRDSVVAVRCLSAKATYQDSRDLRSRACQMRPPGHQAASNLDDLALDVEQDV